MKSHKNTTLLFLLLISLASFSYGQSPTELQCYSVDVGGYNAGERSGWLRIDLAEETISWRPQAFEESGIEAAYEYYTDEELVLTDPPDGGQVATNWVVALDKLNVSLLAINRQSGELVFTKFSLISTSNTRETRFEIQNSKHRCEVQTNLF